MGGHVKLLSRAEELWVSSLPCRESGADACPHPPPALLPRTHRHGHRLTSEPAQRLILLGSAGVDRSRDGRPASEHGHSPGVRQLFSPELAAASL